MQFLAGELKEGIQGILSYNPSYKVLYKPFLHSLLPINFPKSDKCIYKDRTSKYLKSTIRDSFPSKHLRWSRFTPSVKEPRQNKGTTPTVQGGDAGQYYEGIYLPPFQIQP